MEELDGKEMGGSNIEVSLAKPPSDKKKKEEILRARERRMMQMMQVRGGYVDRGPIDGDTLYFFNNLVTSAIFLLIDGCRL